MVKMFKNDFLEDEIYSVMDKNLSKQHEDKYANASKIEKVKALLKTAALILKENKINNLAVEVESILKDLK